MVYERLNVVKPAKRLGDEDGSRNEEQTKTTKLGCAARLTTGRLGALYQDAALRTKTPKEAAVQ